MPSNTTSTGLRQETGPANKPSNPSKNVTLKLPSLDSYKIPRIPPARIDLRFGQSYASRSPGQREIPRKYRLGKTKHNRHLSLMGWCLIAVFIVLSASMTHLAIRNESRLVELERRYGIDTK